MCGKRILKNPSVYTDLDFNATFIPFYIERQAGAWTFFQAEEMFKSGCNVVYCTNIEKMLVNKITNIEDAALFYDVEYKKSIYND